MARAPLILFGAFDRHNLGDILLAHVAVREAAHRPVLFAGLADRDLTPWGGQRVRALAALARDREREWGDAPADLLHVGGELLTCDLYQAAVMLQTAADAATAIARFDRDPASGLAWARHTLGLEQGMAYLAPKALFPRPGRFEYRAVGGVELERLTEAQRREIRARLEEADAVSVRDTATLDVLRGWGIRAGLEPDPASRVPALFGETIACHAVRGEPARVSRDFPEGYLALQFAAEHGDDDSLRLLTACLDSSGPGMGVVMFRAGAAPWHDDLAVYTRLARLMPGHRIHVFESLDVWDICALIAGARACCCGSLHAWVLAKALGVATPPFPFLSRKLAAYQATWPD